MSNDTRFTAIVKPTITVKNPIVLGVVSLIEVSLHQLLVTPSSVVVLVER